MLLLVALLSLQATYEERARAVDEAIVAERLRIASVFEGMKAWAWARAEYRKVLRLAPDSDVRDKLGGRSAISLANEPGLPAQRYHELVGEVCKVAAAKHGELARWCRDNGHPEQARAHWRWLLLHSPVHGEAIQGLGFDGSGVQARDALWKTAPWTSLRRFDGGKAVDRESDIESKWRIASLKRASGDVEWESFGLSEEHLEQIIRQGNGVISVMRTALGDAKALPALRRYLLFDRADFWRYVDDFSGESEERKKILKQHASGYWGMQRGEFAQSGPVRGSDYLEHAIASNAALNMLHSYKTADWFGMGTAATCEILFRGRSEIRYFEMPDGGTGDGEFRGSDRGAWDSNVLNLVRRAQDPPMEDVIPVRTSALKPAQGVKAASVARFLLLRWPHLYRAVAQAYREPKQSPRATVETALGFTLEELDEFWRRWVLASP